MPFTSWVASRGRRQPTTGGGALSAVPLLVAFSVDRLFNDVFRSVSAAVGSEPHMIQFAAIMVILGLALIWWRK